jgi:hypothetical protein
MSKAGEADTLLSSVLKSDPKNQEALIAHGRLLTAQGKPGEGGVNARPGEDHRRRSAHRSGERLHWHQPP